MVITSNPILGAMPLFILCIVASQIGLIVSILLIIGAENSKPALLIPYFVFSVIEIVFVFAFMWRGTIVLVSGFIFILLKVYFCHVVAKAELIQVNSSIKKKFHQRTVDRLDGPFTRTVPTCTNAIS
jgi:hypothetical protein